MSDAGPDAECDLVLDMVLKFVTGDVMESGLDAEKVAQWCRVAIGLYPMARQAREGLLPEVFAARLAAWGPTLEQMMDAAGCRDCGGLAGFLARYVIDTGRTVLMSSAPAGTA